MKTLWSWHNHQERDQYERQVSKQNHYGGHLLCDKGDPAEQQGKNVFNERCWPTGHAIMREHTRALPHRTHKNQSRQTAGLSVKNKTTELLEDNMENISMTTDFLNRSHGSLSIKGEK